MLHWSPIAARAAGILGVLLLPTTTRAQVTPTNTTVRVMASNLSSGSNQRYESPGLNILKGLKPDIVAIQEFNVSNSFGVNTAQALSNMVATTFGTNFVYYREPYNLGSDIPNGIISRYPFVSSGSWVDTDAGVNNRGYAWARIDVPGTNDLHVVSVHFKASNSGTDVTRRGVEAAELKDLITTNITDITAGAWVIVAGDFNIYSETEPAVATLTSFLSDAPVPADLNGGTNTNRGRNERYDRVLPGFSLTNSLTAVVLPSHTLPDGLVFVSTNYTPLSDVTPVEFSDSTATGMQHMGVVKDFSISYDITNGGGGIAPVITDQPQGLTVMQGADATFTVSATGSAPLNYQWRFNLSDIPGATAGSFTRSDVQPAVLGNYSVVVSNGAATVSSSNAVLGLVVPAPVLMTPTPGVVQWLGLSNLAYTVQSRTNLAEGDWTTLGTASSPEDVIRFTNALAGEAQRFYRVLYP